MNLVQHKTTHNFFTCAVLVLVFVNANSTCVENLCETGTKLFKNLCQRFVFSWKICIFGAKLLFDGEECENADGENDENTNGAAASFDVT